VHSHTKHTKKNLAAFTQRVNMIYQPFKLPLREEIFLKNY